MQFNSSKLKEMKFLLWDSCVTGYPHAGDYTVIKFCFVLFLFFDMTEINLSSPLGTLRNFKCHINILCLFYLLFTLKGRAEYLEMPPQYLSCDGHLLDMAFPIP
jgi:hypothetical protein